MKKLRVLVVDDEEGVRVATRRWLSKEKMNVTCVSNGAKAITELVGADYDLVLSDVRMPKMDGFALLDAVREKDLADVFILMSAFGDDAAALDAIRRGAYDYLPKPFSKGELLLTVHKALQREALAKENFNLKQAIRSEHDFAEMVAKSKAMHQIFRTIRKVANFKSTVLITGESGTGKELVARALHFQSKRAEKPFVPVNCGAIPEQLLESELFGHVKGAFTDATRSKQGLFEEAHGGTLFLDEINALPLSLQVKLLRVLQEEEIRRVGDTKAITIDARVVAAGIDDLAELVEHNEFREDLYYRLNVIPIHLPPLRDRREDIPHLIDHFVHLFNVKLGTQIKGLSHESMEKLISYHWPGNIRQLQNLIERTLVLCEKTVVELEDLPPKIRDANASPLLTPFLPEDELSIKRATRALESFLIEKALKQTGGNRTQASKLLEISHRALLYKIKDYELQDVK